MQLLVAHQILVGSAIALCSIFGIRAFVLFARGGTTGDLLLGIAALIVGAALTIYFRKVRAAWRASKDQKR